MIEESLSLWATMASWFTPTVLFLLLNLMIGTIFITSALGAGGSLHKNHQTHVDASFSTQLSRSASLLHRLKSINFNPYPSQEPFFHDKQQHHYHQHHDINSTTHFDYHHQQQQQTSPSSYYSSIHEEEEQQTPSTTFLQRLTSLSFYHNYRSHQEHSHEKPHHQYHHQHVNNSSTTQFSHHHHQQVSSYSSIQEQVAEEKPLYKSPSILQRLTALSFNPYRSHHQEQYPDQKLHLHQQQRHQHMNTNHHHQASSYSSIQEEAEEKPLAKSPSILQRLKSINFYSYIAPQPPKPDTHFGFGFHGEEEKSVEDDHGAGEMTLDEVYSKLKSGEFNRSKSGTKPSAGELPPKLPQKMKKSASVKSAFSHFKEKDVVETNRPETVAEDDGGAAAVHADEEVDAKADDFINRFKQQLELQRIESIIRYKETIGRGGRK